MSETNVKISLRSYSTTSLSRNTMVSILRTDHARIVQVQDRIQGRRIGKVPIHEAINEILDGYEMYLKIKNSK